MAARKTSGTVYIIGAGFSAGLGYPLTSDLLVRLWDRLNADLKKRLHNVIEFHHPGFDPSRFPSFTNVEQLLSEILVNQELFDASRQYTGHFTKKNLEVIQQDLLLGITDWFHELATVVDPQNTKVSWLKEFGERIVAEKATIISFNWDLILDQLLFGKDIGQASYGLTANVANTPVILKPHGSLNWFEAAEGKYLRDKKRFAIFEGEKDGDSVYAFREFRAPRSKRRTYTPLIVPPVYLKNFDKPLFQHIWRKSTSALSRAKKVIFLGYSMPEADIHAQFILRCGFYNQIEGEPSKGRKRTDPTGAAEVTIVNPDRKAAERIAAIAGRGHKSRWFSRPVGDLKWRDL